MSKASLPSYKDLMRPLIQGLKELGGSGTIEEVNRKVAEIAKLSDKQLEVQHSSIKSDGRTEIEYRLAWARTYLKNAELIENSTRGIWALTPLGLKTENIDPNEISRQVIASSKLRRKISPEEDGGDETDIDRWKGELREVLLRMDSGSFERLVQRMLRESGFSEVEVTGRSGDGGIDGKGIFKVGGFLSFYIVFQCKKWQSPVRASNVRDFRGGMYGRADKGLLITTGNFTKDAVAEAKRDGALPIELIDGEELLSKLRLLGLGVRTRKVEIEEVTIDKDWYAGI
ncbi:MAG: restriction endonuclease [Anaerolineales bacterium]